MRRRQCSMVAGSLELGSGGLKFVPSFYHFINYVALSKLLDLLEPLFPAS